MVEVLESMIEEWLGEALAKVLGQEEYEKDAWGWVI